MLSRISDEEAGLSAAFRICDGKRERQTSQVLIPSQIHDTSIRPSSRMLPFQDFPCSESLEEPLDRTDDVISLPRRAHTAVPICFFMRITRNLPDGAL
jgi:hypothetical protein